MAARISKVTLNLKLNSENMIVFSVKDNVQINEYEENKNIRQKFADLTESTDALLRELETVKVAKCEQQESRTGHTVFADNTSTLNYINS